MTTSWRLVATLCLILVLLGLLLVRAAFLCIALPFLALALAPFFLSSPVPTAHAEGKSDRLTVIDGETFEAQVTITNRGPAIPFALITVLLPDRILAEREPSLATSFASGGSCSLIFHATAPRGKHDLDSVCLWASDVLGLRGMQIRLPLRMSIFALPKVQHVSETAILPWKVQGFSGSIRSRTAGSGVEFLGTRAYSPGDPRRQLNWKVAERWDQLLTNQFEEEKAADVGIVVDARSNAEVVTAAQSLFEHSIRAAASIAATLLKGGNRVGLLVYGGGLDWVFPGYGRTQYEKIIDRLCRATLGDHPVFSEFRNLPMRLFIPRSQLLFISPLLPEDVWALRYLRALGFEILAVSPDPIAFQTYRKRLDTCGDLAQRILRARRSTLLLKLRRAGVRILEYDPAVPLAISLGRSKLGMRR